MRVLLKRAAVVAVSVVVAVVMASSVPADKRVVVFAASPESDAAITVDYGFSEIPGSFKPTIDLDMGEYNSPKMVVQVVLAPRNESQLSALLANLYDPKSKTYRQWLAKGEFYSRFAPSDEQIAAVADHLRASGLVVEPSSSPFLVRASGDSRTVAAAFRTSLHTYRNRNGITYFSNASAVKVPAGLGTRVRGVVGLSNTVRMHSQVVLPMTHSSPNPSCEAPYPTKAQLFAAANYGTPFPFGYGGGPGCSGLTPSQVNSIYGAPNLGPLGAGTGVQLALFEVSAYTQSDIVTWAQYYYGPSYTPPIVNIDVDGGPLGSFCPSGDTCVYGYGGDIEVDLDIEAQLGIAPNARHILVYNAPNDYTGQTQLDEYTKIANDNLADVVSSSWALCENDAGAAYAQAQNLIFEQMAAQGQSMFGDAGDTGAFECIRDGTGNMVNVLDPSSQPWVTSVGGTSFESFNPGANPNPSYPAGVETVWNVQNLCNESANEGGIPGGDSGYPLSGYFWCAAVGAGGGGNSQYWGRPNYQFGPGITNPYTAYGNGTTQCALARIGTPCREVPDVSAEADEYTSYAEYCTGTDPTSACAFYDVYFGSDWFAVGGTSLSAPLWSAIIADHDGLWHGRIGNANPLLYFLYNQNYHGYFNDITGIGQKTNNNGFFPTTPGYDLATGIGTPKIGALVTGVP
ncbi:MAG TPA: S53 family peptidase [Terriglobales bacterium]|nr:S53 family peptidase [Terriglobales bacterium]